MSRTLQRWRTARKPHRCTFCRHRIEPGQRYVESTLPPGNGDVGNTTWLRAASHGETGDACEAYREVDPYAADDPFPVYQAAAS